MKRNMGSTSKPGVYLLMLALVSFTLMGCATKKAIKRGLEAMETGDYVSAVTEILSALERQPDHPDAQVLLAQAYPLAVHSLADMAQARQHSPALEDLHDVVSHYGRIEEMARQIAVLNMVQKDSGAPYTVPLQDYTSQLDAARERAAAGYYTAGLDIGERAGQDREQLKQAALLMKQSRQYMGAYKDASDRYEHYRTAATIRMGVMPFINESGAQNYGALGKLITDQVVAALMQDEAYTEFIEVVPLYDTNVMNTLNTPRRPREVKGYRLSVNRRGVLALLVGDAADVVAALIDQASDGGKEAAPQPPPQIPDETTQAEENVEYIEPDIILGGRINQVLVEAPRTSTEVRQESAKVTIREVEEPCKDDPEKTCKRKIKGEVHATVSHYTLKAMTTVAASYRLVEPKTQTLRASDSITGQDEYRYEWVRYRGDERALSYTSERLKDQKANVVPSVAERLNPIISQIASQLAEQVKTHIH